MVRLVKGAYWDAEIKRAQVDGLEDFPVFTRKVHSDVAYLACARRLLAAPDAVYPQFATHNAHTLAAIYQMAGPEFRIGQYEFQCLHGMGEPLYEQVVARDAGGLARPCRIYAPVGTHETLLAYLVRRLLENGSNSSFVNRIANEAVPIDELVADPVAIVEQQARADGQLGLPHPAITLPPRLFGAARLNSLGLDLANEQQLELLTTALQASATRTWRAEPVLAVASAAEKRTQLEVCNPADRRDRVGTVVEANAADVDAAMVAAVDGAKRWSRTPATERAAVLERAADALESQMPSLIGLIVREAGKTCANSVGEVREAVDFLRYYAAQARAELVESDHAPLGPVVCISPWNFPLAIFTGQVAAALAAGNSVLAKPAEQTPLIATQAVALLHAAGVPADALQFLPGRGEVVGARLVADARVRGVIFTGSTDVARLLQRSLAGRLDERGRPIPLIAETGGQNAMVVDSSALPEQVVADVMASAFDSAGQRCSALRVLCVQDDIANRLVPMLEGAMREWRVSAPDRLATDMGPVIDEEARTNIEAHIAAMRARGRHVFQPPPRDDGMRPYGSFIPPTLIEIDSIAELTREVFGPVLHVLRFRRTAQQDLVDAINATGYGLTLGIHSRIDETIDTIVERAHVGNQYVNRNMIGAVVGVQPFGGDGLSGTGPKAGGPLYLRRLLSDPPGARGEKQGVPRTSEGAASTVPARLLAPLVALREHIATKDPADPLVAVCDALASGSPLGAVSALPGPTGERNTYALVPRHAILAFADDAGDRLFQLAHVLAAGARAIWPADVAAQQKLHDLPAEVRARIDIVESPLAADFELALVQVGVDAIRDWSRRLAERPGAVISLYACAPGERSPGAYALERLLVERSVSVNTAAAGGNASLMTLG